MLSLIKVLYTLGRLVPIMNIEIGHGSVGRYKTVSPKSGSGRDRLQEVLVFSYRAFSGKSFDVFG